MSKLHPSDTPRSENYDANLQGEDISEQILRHKNSAAGVFGLLQSRHGTQASQLTLTKGVVGVVAKLGKVSDENLSRLVPSPHCHFFRLPKIRIPQLLSLQKFLSWYCRVLSDYLGTRSMLALVCKSYDSVTALESYDNQGNIDSNAGLHGLGSSIGRSIEGHFDVICLENLRY